MVKTWLKGRLGNCLFEIAAGYAYALDHGIEFTLSNTTKDPVMQPLYFQHLVNPKYNEAIPSKWIREMQHNYQPLPWDESWRGYNIQMMGFWQSEKYFKHRRREVIALFGLPHYIGFNPYISIHVRRGDYLTIPGKHIDNTGEYMHKAINNLYGEMFAVFSDDIDWCKQYFTKTFPDKQFRFVEGQEPLEDIACMASCKHHINSSSTFSWWGAWLGHNPDKVVVTPREWFQSTQKEDTSDIIPPEWIKI